MLVWDLLVAVMLVYTVLLVPTKKHSSSLQKLDLRTLTGLSTVIPLILHSLHFTPEDFYCGMLISEQTTDLVLPLWPTVCLIRDWPPPQPTPTFHRVHTTTKTEAISNTNIGSYTNAHTTYVYVALLASTQPTCMWPKKQTSCPLV